MLPIPVSAPTSKGAKVINLVKTLEYYIYKPQVQPKAVVGKKQDLTDEADQYNPQVNKQKKKQLKSLQKEKKKTRKSIPGNPDAAYDFAQDYAVDDIDIDDIDA